MIDTEIQGEPASVEAAATWLRQVLADGLDCGADALVSARNTAVADWGGEAGPAFGAQMRRGVTATDALVADARQASTASDSFAAALRRAQSRMADIRDQAAAAGLSVSGFVVTSPGDGPPRPGSPPATTSAAAVDHYNASDEAWNEHQRLVTAYNQAQQDAKGTIDDFESACARAQDEYQGMSAWDSVLSGADIAGAAVIGASDAGHTSILRQNVKSYAAEVETWRVRIASTNYDHPLGRVALLRDQDMLFEQQAQLSRAARDLSDARFWPKFSTTGTLVSGGLGAVGAGIGIYSDLQAGESTTQAVTSNIGGVVAGALAGAAIGSAIPVGGTVVGAAVGAGVGLFTSSAIDSLFVNGPDVSRAWVAGGKAIGDTVGVIGDAGGAAIETVSGWFD